MNREHQPCGTCARFIPDAGNRKREDGPGHCEGFDKPAHSTDRPCVLFNEQGVWETRQAQQPVKVERRQKPKPRQRQPEFQP